jgi:hypothetical protein
LVANGNARHGKKITLTPEYAGAVIDNASDTGGANCATNNSGIMTSGYSGDSSPRQNYYQWSSGSASTTCYDVVVQVPIPADFASWAAAPSLYVANTNSSASAVCLQVLNTSGSIETGYSPYSCATTTGTLTQYSSFPALTSANYTPGSYMTVKIRMTSTSSTDLTKIGNLTFQYKSKF